MTLYIDGDAFPNLLKAIVLRAVEKRKIPTLIVANKRVSIGRSPLVKLEVVEEGADKADPHRGAGGAWRPGDYC